MVNACAHCNSADTAPLLGDRITCLNCGRVSGTDGTAYTGEGNTEVVV